MKIFRPASFQGNIKNKNRQYFEGWYLKNISCDRSSVFSIIPGIVTGKNPHAFIQFIDVISGETFYKSYSIGSFKHRKREFYFSIDKNIFSSNGIFMDTVINDFKLKSEISFHENKNFPISFSSPGILGWCSYIPFLECYHSIITMHQRISGYIKMGDKYYSLNNGTGYIEKNWGRNFPSSWLWLQCSSFKTDTVFMLSAAKVPLFKFSRRGVAGFLYHEGEIIHFGTFSSAEMELVLFEKKRIILEVLLKNDCRLQITVIVNSGFKLNAPYDGDMQQRITESSDSSVEITYTDKKRSFTVYGVFAGVEICGETDELF